MLLVIDVGPILSEPSDPERLGETGEMLLAVRDGDRTRYVIPPRLTPNDVEFPEGATPAMNRAIAGERGLCGHQRPFRPRGAGRLPAVGYENWGLVAKMDVDEAYAPVNQLRGSCWPSAA